MTTIAMRDGVIAADSGTTAGGIYVGAMRKITRLADGRLLAATGSIGDGRAVDSWLNAGGDPDKKPKIDDDGYDALCLSPDGSAWRIDSSLTFFQLDAPFHAVGSGFELALGAMAHGATAAEAVKIACRLDTRSREPIHVEALDGR